MTRDELIALMRARSFIIYGNGYVAHRLYECIKSFGLDSSLIGFAVTHAKTGDMGVDGTPVLSVSEIKNKDITLFVAAHDAVAEDMRKTAVALDFRNVFWIYPQLWDLELGEPIERKRRIRTKRLAAAQPFFNLAIDFLTIQHFLDGGSNTIYLKMQSVWSTPAVAEKRLESFKVRVMDAVQNGCNKDAIVKINERQELFDGMHTMAMALYFGVEKILADIYPAKRSFYGANGIYRKGVLLAEDLQKHYTEAEIDEIKAVDRKIRGL